MIHPPVARCLRSRPGGDQLFIAAVTAYRGEEYQRKAWAAGFDGYLEKPIDIDLRHQVLSQISGTVAGQGEPDFG